jgi:hypothetical protein
MPGLEPVIFISHADPDKPWVEPYAVAMAEVFGRANVFYDAWSIRPGDGIVGEIDDALGRCTHFFLFMTETSLSPDREMVKLEWQSAVMRRSEGMRLIPVRLDGTNPPPILLQLRYIDAHTDGFEAARAEMVAVVRGEETFRPAGDPESNLYAVVTRPRNSVTEIEFRARAYQEAHATFLVIFDDEPGEVHADLSVLRSGTHEQRSGSVVLSDERRANYISFSRSEPVTPASPFGVLLGGPLRLVGCAHGSSERTRPIPFTEQ